MFWCWASMEFLCSTNPEMHSFTWNILRMLIWFLLIFHVPCLLLILIFANREIGWVEKSIYKTKKLKIGILFQFLNILEHIHDSIWKGTTHHWYFFQYARQATSFPPKMSFLCVNTWDNHKLPRCSISAVLSF